MSSTIAGVGMAVPSTKATNQDLEAHLDTSDDWIRTRTGIQQRHLLRSGESLVEVALRASHQALQRAAIRPQDLDAIIVGTVSSEYAFPSFACQLQHALGVTQIPAFDVAAACAGFVYALAVTDAMMKTCNWSRVLLVGADALSTMVDWNDRRTAVLFGDGAGALTMVAEPGPRGVLDTILCSAGEYWDLLSVKACGVRGTANSEARRAPEDSIQMRGPELFKIAVKSMEDVSRRVLERAGFTPADIRLLVPHQANLRILTAVADRLQLRQDQVFTNIDRYGNTSAASVPIALAEAHEAGILRPGDLVLINACGGGLTWGASLIRW